ncbi:MAG: serine/threonine protein kinase [Myxococcaceae bacterium]|nr:serine/threonine protein kinase [Myxococcaceae bacterium]
MTPTSTFGRYVVRRRLASGGMGEVFVAEQTGVGDFKKPLALKLMLQHVADDPRLQKLFLGEVRLATRLQHPNIVQVLDAGLIDGRYFLTMELVEGATLSALVSKARAAEERISAEVLCHVARQTLEGLRYAQELKDEQGQPLDVVHRDISPSNILVSRLGEVKLTDFGIAKVRGDESNTAPGEVRGKLAYLAPEVLRGASASQRSDVYALGVTLYRLAALESPFSRGGDTDPTADVLRHDVVPLAQRRPDLPAPLVDAITRAMAADPKARFANAAAMLDAIPRGDFEARQQELKGLVLRMLGDAQPVATPQGTAPHELEVLTAKSLLAGETVIAAEPKSKKQSRVLVALAAACVLGAVVAFLSWPATPAPVPAPVVAAVEPPPAPPEPAEPEPQLAAPEPEPEPEPAPTRKPARRPNRAPPAQTLASPAYLSVQATPWAHVELNGKRIGQTPLGRISVETPTATLRLTNPDYRTVERKLKLSAGEEQKITVALEPKEKR